MAPPKTPDAPRGTIKGTAYHNLVKFTIRATPLPDNILHFILDNIATLKQLQHQHKMGDPLSVDDVGNIDEEGANLRGDVTRKPSVRPDEFWAALANICEAVGGEWKDVAERAWSFGPQPAGGCLLIDARKNSFHSCVIQFL